MKVQLLTFSPSGKTAACGKALGQGFAEALGTELVEQSLNAPSFRQESFQAEKDAAYVIGFPVYAGRLPNLLRDYVASMQGHGAPLLAFVTYGNRDFQDGLSELAGLLEEGGFHLLAGASLVCEHSFATALASGRPTAEDLTEMRDFGRKVAEKLASASEEKPEIPGAYPPGPYYLPKDPESGEVLPFLQVKVQTKNTCTECGACVEVCPFGSIPAEDPKSVVGPCVKCQACVLVCPVDAKHFDAPAFKIHKEDLEASFPERKESGFYL